MGGKPAEKRACRQDCRRYRLQRDLGFDYAFVERVVQSKSESLANFLHGAILRQDVGRDAIQLLGASDFDQTPYELEPQALALDGIGHNGRELGLPQRMLFGEPADAQDLPLARERVAPLGYQRHFTVVIDEADAHETLVCDTLIELG